MHGFYSRASLFGVGVVGGGGGFGLGMLATAASRHVAAMADSSILNRKP